ncbi:MAG: arylsulfatase [Candidatus Aminicenantaceae bacterium]
MNCKHGKRFIITGLIFAALALLQQAAYGQSRPNVILCMTDDQGFGDLGFHGNPMIRTPVLDRLAAKSVRFNNFYVSPVCAPTRSSLMTGRWSLRTGVYDTYNGAAIMASEETTVAEILNKEGYRTGIFGKWHLGDNFPFRPKDQGFEESLVHGGGGIGQVGDVKNYFEFDRSYFDPILWENGVPVQTRGYCSDVYTESAMKFIEVHREEPFFVYLSFNAPHTPLQVPEEFNEIYADKDPAAVSYSRQGRPLPKMSDGEKDAARRVYAMVTNIDRNLGRLFECLRSLKLDSNTVVIFLTDNGPQQRRYTAGLRGQKSSVYEGGVRVPCFIHIPWLAPGPAGIDIPAAHIDMLPTILGLCGIPLPQQLEIDGHSLVPLIQGRSVSWAERPLFFHWQRGFPELYRNIAVRKGHYKLVGHAPHTAGAEEFELFDLQKDPYEMEDISVRHPEKALELKQEFDRWYSDIMESPHLKEPQKIRLGSPHEDPVLLNRNDAKGDEGIWAQDRIYGYWDVQVEDDNFFDFTFYFRESVNQEGTMKLRLGTTQRSLRNTDPAARTLEMRRIFLKKGNYRLEPWYRAGGGNHLPFYVEVRRSRF